MAIVLVADIAEKLCSFDVGENVLHLRCGCGRRIFKVVSRSALMNPSSAYAAARAVR
jgi:hypothetical protein